MKFHPSVSISIDKLVGINRITKMMLRIIIVHKVVSSLHGASKFLQSLYSVNGNMWAIVIWYSKKYLSFSAVMYSFKPSIKPLSRLNSPSMWTIAVNSSQWTNDSDVINNTSGDMLVAMVKTWVRNKKSCTKCYRLEDTNLLHWSYHSCLFVKAEMLYLQTRVAIIMYN